MCAIICMSRGTRERPAAGKSKPSTLEVITMEGKPVGAGYLVFLPQVSGCPRLFATEQEAREYYEDDENE